MMRDPGALRCAFEMVAETQRCTERAWGLGDWLGWSAEAHDAKARRAHWFAPRVDDEGTNQ
jgi:hypothetical protein